jgi:hypothetical protein
LACSPLKVSAVKAQAAHASRKEEAINQVNTDWAISWGCDEPELK